MDNVPPISKSKIALIVAPSYKGLREELPGTKYDVQVMKNVTKKFHFTDVREIVEDNATKEKILQSLSDVSSTASEGDIVLFYFSGHGCYLPRTKDEGLLPAGATEEKLKDEAEDICITGIDLLPFLEQLAEKKVKVTVIFDCCHSGQLYRVTELEKSGCTDIIPRQVVIQTSLDTIAKSPSLTTSEGTGNKLLRGGWTPKEKDTFFYIAACSPVQIAVEHSGKGGRLTMAIESVVNSITCFEERVSYRAFFRLIEREFKKNGWYESQTPQLEGASLDTELFGEKIVKVPSETGIAVNEVNDDEVILNAGCLQNLIPGVYNVFDTTVVQEAVNLGKESSDWLGRIDVSEGNIGRAETSSLIVERKSGKNINPRCLAYLETPNSIKTNALVKLAPDSVPAKNIEELLDHIKKTKILNVSTKPLKIEDADLITIGIEEIQASGQNEKKKYWVARRRGKVIVPPLGLGREETMAGNLSRYLRYQSALASAQSPKMEDELLKNVSVKVVKIEKVKPFRALNSKKQRIEEGLEHGKDLYEDASQHPFRLLSHSLTGPNRNKLKDETGDAFVYQVTNQNKDTVHICVLFYQFDGAIKAIYPPKKGSTEELRGGGTVEDIFRVFIPFNSLRKMAQPDPNLPEPDSGLDTIIVYATSKSADFESLLQTAIQTDPDLIARGQEEQPQALSDLAKFAVSMRKRCIEEPDPNDDFKWFVAKRNFAVVKNTNE